MPPSFLRYTFYLILLLLSTQDLYSQRKLSGSTTRAKGDPSLGDTTFVKKSTGFKDVASIDMYLLMDMELDTMVVDTTLSIKKDYKFNYLQRDMFGLMPFANIGQTYNTLSFNQITDDINPLFGARARHFNYLESDQVKYYEVPTPWTRLTYKTAFEQGQMLDAFFTVNLSKQFNFSIAYKGLRSLGTYQNSLTSSGNFRFTSSYKSKKQNYIANGHVVMQDLLNQENGGLKDEDLENFESGNEEFIDRSVFDPNFENAESILVGKRYFINQTYYLVKQNDSLKKNELALTNYISFEDKYYQFYQTGTPANSFFGDSFTDDVNDRVTLEYFKASLGFKYFNNVIGDLAFSLNYNDYNYGYDSVVLFPQEIIPNRIKTKFLGAEGSYKKAFGGFLLEGNGSLNLSDEFVGSSLSGTIHLNLFDDLVLSGGLRINSKLPNFNYLLYQSDYINYNWNNYESFKNVNTQQLIFSLKSQKLFNTNLDISNIDNYTYFNLESNIEGLNSIKPTQYNNPIQYLRLKISKEIKVGNFALDNSVMYQNVISDDDVLNVPTIISRNTLYYSNEIFKKAMKLQTGVTLNYFTKYNMNGYDPLLAEFYTQNNTELGGFPRLDFFINAKVRQTRIFLKAEHFNSSFTGYNYYSAPNQPFRDFTVRFGLVWDFFL